MRVWEPDAVQDLQSIPKPRNLQVQFAKTDTGVELVTDRQTFAIEMAADEAQILITRENLQAWE